MLREDMRLLLVLDAGYVYCIHNLDSICRAIIPFLC